MEFLVAVVMIIILLVLLGFGLGQIATLFMAVLGVVIVLTGLFFAICLAVAISSKRVRAEFSEFDENTKFPCAVYEISGEKHRNLFPAEMVMKNKIYVPGKPVNVLLCRIRKSVIDKNALITIIVGSSIFIPLAVLVITETIKIVTAIT